MKIAVFGASGMIGQRVAQEALSRGHEVTAIVRDLTSIQLRHPQLTIIEGDALNREHVTELVAGHDVVISAIRPSESQPWSAVAEAAQSLLEGVKRAGVKSLLVVGGAGTMEVAPGVLALDVIPIPEAWKPEVMAKLEEWEVYRKNSDVDWTYVSPAVFIEPGERTGIYRLGINQLVMNAQGESRISAEDYAIALLDEVEQPRFVRQRLSAAY
jgi:putative NADH-flavin reductase